VQARGGTEVGVTLRNVSAFTCTLITT